MTPMDTDMPFKVSHRTIVILKALPVLQCEGCGEYVIEDHVMSGVEAIFQRVDPEAELKIITYAA